MSAEQPPVAPPLEAWFGSEKVELKALGEGHINGTWLVRSASGDFVLQQISRSVFPHPERVAANQALLLRAVSARDAELDWGYQLPRPLPAAGGETLVFGPVPANSESANTLHSAWRLCRYFANTRTLQSLDNTQQARAAGRAFGELQSLARSIEPADVQEVIPGFFKLAGYQRALAVAWASCHNPDQAEHRLIAEIVERTATYVADDTSEMRVIHGDCKVNNLLFAEQADEVVAILDLDTLMAGAWWLDFGDLVRSAAFVNNKQFDPELYAALAQGFFTGRGGLQGDEVAAAVRSPGYVAYMLTIRFLTDHLQGDRYFKVQARGENLQRAQSQFAQLLQLEQDDCVRAMTKALASAVTSA